MNSAQSGILGKQVILRPICSDDIETLRGFVNDPEVMRFSNVYRPINDFQQELWYQDISKAADSVWFAIDDIRKPQCKLIGTCCLVGIDWVSKSAEFRIRIGDRSAWGEGLGTEASQKLIRYGFRDLNLTRIWLRVFGSNHRAIHLYQKLGFQVEGRLRQALLIQGSSEDLVLMGLLRSEWQSSDAEPQACTNSSEGSS